MFEEVRAGAPVGIALNATAAQLWEKRGRFNKQTTKTDKLDIEILLQTFFKMISHFPQVHTYLVSAAKQE